MDPSLVILPLEFLTLLLIDPSLLLGLLPTLMGQGVVDQDHLVGLEAAAR